MQSYKSFSRIVLAATPAKYALCAYISNRCTKNRCKHDYNNYYNKL